MIHHLERNPAARNDRRLLQGSTNDGAAVDVWGQQDQAGGSSVTALGTRASERVITEGFTVRHKESTQQDILEP